MTLNYGEVKPSLDEFAHYGVLGMKWGKHRAKATPTEIRKARRNVRNQMEKLSDKKAEVKRTGKGEKQLAKMKTDFLKNPDRVVAARLTRGEKAVIMILAGPAAPISIAAIGSTSAISRRIERKQETGAYNKK